jgi:hypothetical protein
MRTDTLITFESIINLMISGKDKYIHPDNKKLIPYYPMTLNQACRELDMLPQQFFYYLNTYPALKEKYEAIKVARREKVKHYAEDNLDKAIGGKMDIDDTDLANLSLKYLEKTDKAFNPKQEIDVISKNLHFNMSDEQIMSKIQELMKK